MTGSCNNHPDGNDVFQHIRKQFTFMVENETTGDSETSLKPMTDLEGTFWQNSATPTSAVFSFGVGKKWYKTFEYLTVVATKTNSQFWVFSTAFSIIDQEHAVSGNRQFGITSNSNGNFTFYTRGADRPTGIIDALAASAIFSGADKLWRTVMNNVATEINRLGGSATVNTPFSTRVSWSDDVQKK